MFSKDFKEFVQLLIANKVDYLIVGGYAVGFHGYPRYTGDLDIWLNQTLPNSKKILQCVNEFGFSSVGLTVEDFMKKGSVIQLGYPPLRIDILSQIDGVHFEECFKNKVEVEIDELKVNFISYHDLIKNKKATGRHRDLDDLENLAKG